MKGLTSQKNGNIMVQSKLGTMNEKNNSQEIDLTNNNFPNPKFKRTQQGNERRLQNIDVEQGGKQILVSHNSIVTPLKLQIMSNINDSSSNQWQQQKLLPSPTSKSSQSSNILKLNNSLDPRRLNPTENKKQINIILDSLKGKTNAEKSKNFEQKNQQPPKNNRIAAQDTDEQLSNEDNPLKQLGKQIKNTFRTQQKQYLDLPNQQSPSSNDLTGSQTGLSANQLPNSNTGLNAFVTRVAKGELIGVFKSSEQNNLSVLPSNPLGRSLSNREYSSLANGMENGMDNAFKYKANRGIKLSKFNREITLPNGVNLGERENGVNTQTVPGKQNTFGGKSTTIPLPSSPFPQPVLKISTTSKQILMSVKSENSAQLKEKKDNIGIQIQEVPQPNENTAPSSNKCINLLEIIQSTQKNNPKYTYYYNVPMTNALQNGTQNSPDPYFEQLFKEHFIQSFHSLNFCKTLKPVSAFSLKQKKLSLPIHPHNKGKKTVVFDLDETLIHCNENASIPSDVIIPIKFPNNLIMDAGVNIRPHAKECLEELSEYFEIIIFTASHSCYAVKVLEHLDPEDKYISHKLFRESCIQTPEGVHVKDMRIFANRNIKDIVLVDNAAYSFGFQIDNGIPIIPYYNNKSDLELKHLSSYLINNILDCPDVREVNKAYFKMYLHQSSNKIEQAANKIYNL